MYTYLAILVYIYILYTYICIYIHIFILPSGNLLQFAIENGPVEIVCFRMKNGDTP